MAKELTPRETQVLMMLADGSSYKEIGTELGVAEGTVDTYRKHIFAKLHARNAAHAVALAYHYGIFSPMKVGNGNSSRT